MDIKPHYHSLLALNACFAFSTGCLLGIANIAYAMPMYFLGWAILFWVVYTQRHQTPLIKVWRECPLSKVITLTLFLNGFVITSLVQDTPPLDYLYSTAVFVFSNACLVTVFMFLNDPSKGELYGQS